MLAAIEESAVGPLLSDDQASEYAVWFRALADPTRILILHLLARSAGPLCVQDIVAEFPLQQSSISHHLRILKETRFVFAERRGTFMYYSVNQACLSEFPTAARHIMGI